MTRCSAGDGSWTRISLYFRWLSQWPQADYVGWNIRRSRWDLNPQPSDRQSDALANCATTPKKGGLLLTTAWYRQTSVTAPIRGSSIGKLAYLFLVRDDMLPPLLIYSRQWPNRVYTHSTFIPTLLSLPLRACGRDWIYLSAMTPRSQNVLPHAGFAPILSYVPRLSGDYYQ